MQREAETAELLDLRLGDWYTTVRFLCFTLIYVVAIFDSRVFYSERNSGRRSCEFHKPRIPLAFVFRVVLSETYEITLGHRAQHLDLLIVLPFVWSNRLPLKPILRVHLQSVYVSSRWMDLLSIFHMPRTALFRSQVFYPQNVQCTSRLLYITYGIGLIVDSYPWAPQSKGEFEHRGPSYAIWLLNLL